MAEEQVEAPAYKPSPFMKAAAQIIEASDGHVPADLDWDPLTMSDGGGSGLPSDAIELPTELMMNLVGPGLAAVRQAKPTPEVPLAPSQERARKRLQQRKEAAERAAAEKAAQQEKEVEEPLDESWIDQLEQKDAKKKANREKAVQIRKERKKARKADLAAKQEALESADVQEEEEEEVEEVAEPEPVQQEPVEIEEEDYMQPVEQSKQRRKRQARQAAKLREEEEQAKREEEIKREEEEAARLEAERKQQEAEAARKAKLEQERLEQERKRLEEQREAERKREEERQKREAEKREAERREMEKREIEKRKQEARERREQKERSKAREEAKAEAEKEDKAKEEAEEAQPDDRRRRGAEARDENKPRQGRKQDKDEVKETGEQPTQVKSLRQTLTPSQLRRQQRKRQREARRAAEAAAREDDDSEEEEAKPSRSSEQKQNERQSERQMERPAKTKESRPSEAKAEAEEARSKTEEGKRARGASVSSVASWDSAARKEEEGEPAQAPRSSSELRKDAEAFPTPRSQSSGFDPSRQGQELDQNVMQPVMGITTLMISQIPEQTDAESFRRQLDSWGFIGTYNFFYMPPDVSEGWGGRCVFINFVDQAMANMCMSAFQQCPSEGVAAPYNVQGLENNIAHFSQFVGAGDMVNGPLIVPTPTPSAWALNGAQAMMNSAQGKFSPQIRGQFHKTKMCAFHKKKKCTMGVACPFAHCKEELNSPPDLSKTKLCVNFFRRKCNDVNCKFAHGHQELRATGSVYKTELCRAWASGACKAGDTCRYAHGVKELRGSGMGGQYMGYSMDDDYMSIDGQMGCDVMGGLQGIWEDEAAAMQHYNGYGSSMSSYTAQGSGENRGRSAPSSGFSSGQPQDGTAEGYNDAMSDMGLSDVSTLCPGEGRLSRQQTAPPTASFPADAGRSIHSNVVLRVKGTFMESVFLDEEVERLPLRRSWSDGDLPQLQDMEGEQDL